MDIRHMIAERVVITSKYSTLNLMIKGLETAESERSRNKELLLKKKLPRPNVKISRVLKIPIAQSSSHEAPEVYIESI